MAHDGTVYVSTNLLSSLLVTGSNVVAVELHQDAGDSSDISFDLMLWSGTIGGPKLSIVSTDTTHADVSWKSDAIGYTLQGNTTDVGNSGGWSNMGVPIIGAGSTNVSTASGLKFFRLIKP